MFSAVDCVNAEMENSYLSVETQLFAADARGKHSNENEPLTARRRGHQSVLYILSHMI